MIFDQKHAMEDLALRLDTKLAPYGFQLQRKAARFQLSGREGTVIAELQRSSKSSTEALVLTANVGIWNATLAAKLGGPTEVHSVGAMDCLWWIRAGQLRGGREQWWTVGVAEDAVAVPAEIWSSFLSPAVDLFAPLRDDFEFLQYLLSNQPPFLDPMNRWAYVLALASGICNTDAAKLAAVELNRIGQTRTLPIGHTMLLRSITI